MRRAYGLVMVMVGLGLALGQEGPGGDVELVDASQARSSNAHTRVEASLMSRESLLGTMHDSMSLRVLVAQTHFPPRRGRALMQSVADLGETDAGLGVTFAADDDDRLDQAEVLLDMEVGNSSDSSGGNATAASSTCCACPAVEAAAGGTSANSTGSSTTPTASPPTATTASEASETDLGELGEGVTFAEDDDDDESDQAEVLLDMEVGNSSDSSGGNATAACCPCHPSKTVTLTLAMDEPKTAAAKASFQAAFKEELSKGLDLDASRITFGAAAAPAPAAPAPAAPPPPATTEQAEDLGEDLSADLGETMDTEASKYAVQFTVAAGASNDNTTKLINTLATQISNPTSPLSMGQMMSQIDKSAGMAVGTVENPSTCKTLAAKWGYEDAPSTNGPATWRALYPKCGMGATQSPVRLPIQPPKKAETVFRRLDFDYKISPITVMNDGRVLMSMVNPGSTFRVSGDDKSTSILQYVVFHSPSEHVFTDANGNDIRYAGELQLHHRTTDGRMVVVAVLLKVNAPSPFIDKLFGKLPKTCESTTTKEPVKFEDILPFSRSYYMYYGSLTSPPCTDGVTWYVLREQASLSLEQLQKIRETMKLDVKKPTKVSSARGTQLGQHTIKVLDRDEYPEYTFSKTLMGNVRPLQELGARKLWATPTAM